MAEVCLPGTGGMIPLKDRWLACCYISHNGQNFLIDCGEGTQIALEEAGMKAGRIDALFITHFHADHIAGLPGLLMAMANKGKRSKLTVIGPKKLAYVISALCVIVPGLPFEVELIEVKGEESISFGEIEVKSLALSHRIDCLGYSFIINKKPVFSPEKARALNIPLKEYKTLHAGRSIRLPNGKTIEPGMVIEAVRSPLKITYCTDTLPIPEIADFAANSNLFICEGMYADDEMQTKMEEKHHMLISQSAELAKKAKVSELWLTHFSPAFKKPIECSEYVAGLFPNAKIGTDGMKGEFK